MADRSSTKVLVPHPANCSITGILEQLETRKPTHGRRIALVRNAFPGDAHKDYLFQRRLAQRLPQDSFRFDFRGNHETPGTWCHGGMQDDVEDLSVVARYMQSVYGYVIDLVVGHSRGSIVGMRWLATAPEARSVSAFINASGRYRMSAAVQAWREGFAADGYYDWTTSVARKLVTVRVHPVDLELFVNWDTSFVWDQFPAAVHVLTIHGLADKTVPPYDATIYARALGAPSRAPGTHILHMVEDADHNFTGRQDQVVDYMLEWWDLHERGELKSSGLWMTGVRGKL
ncbi:ectomycorrhiza-regulated esterase [Mycena rosella]|uniref:Ectomycorrhiza-regulated esterase n=1 Tax=Mycena rosella TaxID=1033263 RepID=A0AAD7D735_MYCRO|nr:ectomycorrhiza-regulated esterase [Mycena rosella]